MTETIETETNAPVIEPEAAEPAVDAANATTPFDPTPIQNTTDAANTIATSTDPAALIDTAKETLMNTVTSNYTTSGVEQLVSAFTSNTESIFANIAHMLNNAAKYLSPDIVVPYLESVQFLKLFSPHTYATMILIAIVSFIIWRGAYLAKWLFGITLLILGVMLGLDLANYFLA